MNFPPQDWALIIALTLFVIFTIGTLIWLIQGELEYRKFEKLTELKNSSTKKEK